MGFNNVKRKKGNVQGMLLTTGVLSHVLFPLDGGFHNGILQVEDAFSNDLLS